MRMSKLVGRQVKETPKDAQTVSHRFLLRGGYIRSVSAGIYTLLPLGRRVVSKVEAIIREEMDRVDGQEMLMPVVLPGELWEESGRYDTVGDELLRFQDRNEKAMVLGMTHEEAVVHMARTELSSYKQLPAMVYQVQTKYRDEARPRAGLIRVREFTMKDGYSFHANSECLEAYYERCHDAYVSIFQRIGMKDVQVIQADPGMMGGNVSHEFMAVAECGEDTIFLSPDRSYRSNRDVATTGLTFVQEGALPLEKVHTPGKTSIEDVAAFLDATPEQTGKAVFYTTGNDELVFVVIRGDLEVNETKLRNHLKESELRLATDREIEDIGSVPGYASPLGVAAEKVQLVFDRSARHSSNLIVGANEVDYHYRNFNFERDLAELAESVEIVDIATARAGDPCPLTGEPLEITRGIEVGNIFQLGTKYSAAMGATFLDPNGKRAPLIMGCYGIGIGRAMAAVIEQSHDQYGPIWPMSIAPYQVHICALNYKKEAVRTVADLLYAELHASGFEVLLDDRGEKAGFSFADADLIGIPLRLIISPKTIANGEAEFKRRGSEGKDMVALDAVVERLKAELTRES